jgi:RNA polymerase sigma factor (sigma-70 family)
METSEVQGWNRGRRLAALYEREATSCVRLAYLITSDRQLSEDLVQDAFLKVAGRSVYLRDEDRIGAYLRRSVINGAISHFRRRSVEENYLRRERALGGTAVVAPEDPDDEVRSALMTLGVRQRTAIVLRYYEDLSEARIAELMRCRPGTVKSLISRGLDNLRKQVAHA